MEGVVHGDYDQSGKLSFIQVAVAVLRRARQPLTAEEIVRQGQEQGLLTSRGKTPINTMNASLYREIARHPRGPLLKVAQSGPQRAARGSVRWELSDD